MTMKAQDTTEQQREPGDAPVSGKRGALAGVTQASDRQAAARQPRSILGNSRAVCRAIVENLFGKRHWAAQWVLELCNADPQFLTHLAEQPRGYAHFLCLIRMAPVAQGGNGGDAQEMARLLCIGNKRALLEELSPSCPTDIIDLLHKLPKKPFHEEGYRALMSALEDASMREYLLHSKRISWAVICSLSLIVNIPARFRPATMRFIDVDYSDEHQYACKNHFRVLQIFRAIENFNLKVTEQEFAEAARKAEFVSELEDWVREKVSKLPFPPPPWDGNDKIRPIRSSDELEKVAARFNFVLPFSAGIHASRIVAGYDYFYVCDHIPAMIIIRRGVYQEWCVSGWAILDIRGNKNKRIGSIQEYELRQAFHKFLDASIPPQTFGYEVHYCR